MAQKASSQMTALIRPLRQAQGRGRVSFQVGGGGSESHVRSIQASPCFQAQCGFRSFPTYLLQRDLPSYDDPLPESEKGLLGGSPGGHVREIAAGYPAANQPGPLPITHEEPRGCGQGLFKSPTKNPAVVAKVRVALLLRIQQGEAEGVSAARPRPPDRPLVAEELDLPRERRAAATLAHRSQ
jgi:hypothetical protein